MIDYHSVVVTPFCFIIFIHSLHSVRRFVPILLYNLNSVALREHYETENFWRRKLLEKSLLLLLALAVEVVVAGETVGELDAVLFPLDVDGK